MANYAIMDIPGPLLLKFALESAQIIIISYTLSEVSYSDSPTKL